MIVAHGLGVLKDLPISGVYFLYGGAIVLGLSFAALGGLWTEPRLEQADRGRPLPPLLQRILLSRALRVAVGAISIAFFVVVLLAAFFGTRSVQRNLAPTTVWVLFWLGLVWVTVFLGNVWAVLSPFRAVADAAAWLTRPLRWEPRYEYPERLGRWPAAALLLAFTALELAYPDPSDPRMLGAAIVVYAAITWACMLIFGREKWLENGEAFHIYFGLFARLAPLAVRGQYEDREVVVRPPLAGLATLRVTPGTLAFVAVMLGSVAFDSITRTGAWQRFQSDQLTDQPTRGLVHLAALAGVCLFVAGAYLAAVRLARVGDIIEPGEDPSLAPFFVASLVPIALVYSIAHYVSLVLVQSQVAISLVSDPAGKGWDLFGTAAHNANLTPIGTNALWYVQVATLITGHVLGLTVAHDRAVTLYEGSAALRSQFAMLAVMIMYTVGGLYLLSLP